MSARSATLLLLGGLMLLTPFKAEAACCSYGCCDCSCTSALAQKKAEVVARQMAEVLRRNGLKGSVRSFEIEADASPNVVKPVWSCTPTENGANCVR